MADPARARKLADRIQVIIAKRLDRGLRDPRLGFVTITDVQVTGDLQHATVFYTVYGTDEERADTAAALQAATGMLRSEVGKNITARLTPTLAFQLDAIPENAAHIELPLGETFWAERFGMLTDRYGIPWMINCEGVKAKQSAA